MRLQKFLALCAVNSRRKAEELILSGAVSVNGQLAKIGTCVDLRVDTVAINGITVSSKHILEKRVPIVLVMNKPPGIVCSHFDKCNSDTIFDLVPKYLRKGKLMFCGRLDKKAEGMLLLTNDGEFAQKLTHPSYGIKKRYEVAVSRPPDDVVLRKMTQGINSEGEFLRFDKIVPIGRGRMKNLVFEVTLSQGKKNEIYRMFKYFGIFVNNLKRVKIGGLLMRGIALGKCKQLTKDEIDLIFSEKFFH